MMMRQHSDRDFCRQPVEAWLPCVYLSLRPNYPRVTPSSFFGSLLIHRFVSVRLLRCEILGGVLEGCFIETLLIRSP